MKKPKDKCVLGKTLWMPIRIDHNTAITFSVKDRLGRTFMGMDFKDFNEQYKALGIRKTWPRKKTL